MNQSLNINLIFYTGIILIIVALAVFVFLLIAKIIIRKIMAKNRFFDHVVYLIKLPKDKPGDQEREVTVQQLHEEIAKGETIFSSIGGLRAQKGFMPWFFGRNDHFSFELVASRKKIAFYAVTPREMGRYLEQQVHAH